jgi:hypothetical protein
MPHVRVSVEDLPMVERIDGLRGGAGIWILKCACPEFWNVDFEMLLL